MNNKIFIVNGSSVLRSTNGSILWSAGEVGLENNLTRAVVVRAGRLAVHASWLPVRPALPAGAELVGLRELFDSADATDYQDTLRACHLVHWARNTTFCGICGSTTRWHDSETALVCPSCGETFYPRIAPAVIIAITRTNGAGKTEVLLARHLRDGKPSKNYGLVAGYIEPGESAEEAAEREILEETGFRVRNLEYVCSQAWPYPDSLMLGFRAEYESGVEKLQASEIAEIGWFSADNLPQLPPRVSLSRQLTDLVLEMATGK